MSDMVKQGVRVGVILLASVALWLGGLFGIGAIVMKSYAIASPANQQMTTEVRVHLGNETNELKFVPDRLNFEAGKRYKLILNNPSSSKHYFTAKDFADAIWSQKVDAGNVEIKGAIHELELRPGSVAEWVFVPMKSGTYELHCSIAGHAEAGMVGQLVINN